MTSPKQIKANRKNALASTGPSDTSKTRFNAVKHGLFSKEIVVHGIDEQEFTRFRQSLWSDIGPVGELEELLTDRLVTCSWRWKRVIRYESAAIQEVSTLLPGSKFDGSIPRKQDHELIQRYEAHLSREFFRVLHELQRLQAGRLGKGNAVPLAVDLSVDSG